KKLAPHGILAVHISNRHFDLAPVVANVARHIVMEDPDQTESTLTVESGKASGAVTLPVPSGDLARTLAVDNRGNLVLLEDAKKLDKKLATVIARDNGWYFIEPVAGSTLEVNGVNVMLRARLNSGDLVSAGGNELRFAQSSKKVPLVCMRGNDHEAF